MDTSSEQNYLSSKDAGAILGYTHDYISRLCRHGKMSGLQKGREWYVTKEELEAFKGRHELELQEKKKELSKKFSQIRTEAEAKKRRARELANNSVQSVSESHIAQENFSETSAVSDVPRKKIKFVMPREFVAIGALALVLISSAFFDLVSATSHTFSGQSIKIKNFSLKETGDIIGQGIQDTIYAQSTVVEPVAAVFRFMPYLADGYWEFFTTIGQLPKEMYISLWSMGNGYLVLYEVQGEVLYHSIQNLDTMGATILKGYELVGESFLFGSKDIVAIYAHIFHIDSYLQTSSKQFQKFTANTAGGFEYAAEDLNENVFKNGAKQFSTLLNSLEKNINMNVSAMQTTLLRVSGKMGAYAGSFFEFNLIEKKSQIRAIRIIEE